MLIVNYVKIVLPINVLLFLVVVDLILNVMDVKLVTTLPVYRHLLCFVVKVMPIVNLLLLYKEMPLVLIFVPLLVYVNQVVVRVPTGLV